jgi:DNA-binding PadR family transcriptional regulator
MAPRTAHEDDGDVAGSDAAREAPQAELPAAHALLGLLALSGGTAHGYDLARQFRHNQPLGGIIRLKQAMLYKHLKKLANLGWVTVTVEEQGTRPPRQRCHLTPAGSAELRRWLSEPVARTREIRLEFMVKLYFAWQLDTDLARRLVREQRAASSQIAESLARQLEAVTFASRSDREDRFLPRVLELRLEQTEAVMEWLDRVEQTFAAPDGENPPLRGWEGISHESV